MIELSSVSSEEDLLIIEKLAELIWKEHYIPIVGEGQVEYMLEKFQSVKSMKVQIKEGAEYYIIKLKEQPIGYLSFSKNSKSIFLSKIYILNQFRGKKFGKTAMLFVEDIGKEIGCTKLYLTVNKNNSDSIKVYEKIGFNNLGSYITNIGGGYIMDDYKMEKNLY